MNEPLKLTYTEFLSMWHGGIYQKVNDTGINHHVACIFMSTHVFHELALTAGEKSYEIYIGSPNQIRGVDIYRVIEPNVLRFIYEETRKV